MRSSREHHCADAGTAQEGQTLTAQVTRRGRRRHADLPVEARRQQHPRHRIQLSRPGRRRGHKITLTVNRPRIRAAANTEKRDEFGGHDIHLASARRPLSAARQRKGTALSASTALDDSDRRSRAYQWQIWPTAPPGGPTSAAPTARLQRRWRVRDAVLRVVETARTVDGGRA